MSSCWDYVSCIINPVVNDLLWQFWNHFAVVYELTVVTLFWVSFLWFQQRNWNNREKFSLLLWFFGMNVWIAVPRYTEFAWETEGNRDFNLVNFVNHARLRSIGWGTLGWLCMVNGMKCWKKESWHVSVLFQCLLEGRAVRKWYPLLRPVVTSLRCCDHHDLLLLWAHTRTWSVLTWSRGKMFAHVNSSLERQTHKASVLPTCYTIVL